MTVQFKPRAARCLLCGELERANSYDCVVHGADAVTLKAACELEIAKILKLRELLAMALAEQ